MGNGTYKSNIENGAKVTITNNAGSGILTKQKACNLTIGSATITNNGTGSINQGNIGAEFGGGINNVGTVVLDPSVQIYNNHASKAGDDLYSTGAGATSIGDTGTRVGSLTTATRQSTAGTTTLRTAVGTRIPQKATLLRFPLAHQAHLKAPLP